MCLLAICLSCVKKKKKQTSSELLPIFISFGFLMLSSLSCFYILDIWVLVISFANIFFPFSRLSFHFVNGFLCCAKTFKFYYVLLVCFCFSFFYFRRHAKKYCYNLCQCYTYLFSRSFMGLYLKFILSYNNILINVKKGDKTWKLQEL